MLGFFPTPYPDEILYSILARAYVRSGNISPSSANREFFGNPSVTSTVDLPSNLDSLVENFPLNCNLTTEELIIEHTLYTFYAPFLPTDRAKTLFKLMKEDNGAGIHTKTGIMASTIKLPSYLRYCPSCAIDDLNLYGELYWHRIHQVPGVLICTKHEELLANSTIRVKSLNKREYFPASEETCRLVRCIIPYNKSLISELISFTKEVEWLVNNYVPSKELNWYRFRYLDILKEKGLATVNGRVYQHEFVNSFMNYYDNDFLELVQSAVNQTNPGNWLVSIVRKHQKAFHPIRHILITRYLCGTFQEFIAKKDTFNPFGSGPWPCLNTSANHYSQPVISDLKITHCADTKMPIGTFTCSCGFVYSRRGPDRIEEDKYRIGKIKDFGHTWKAALIGFLEIDDISFREIARRLNVDTNTVIKYSKILAGNPDNEKMVSDNLRIDFFNKRNINRDLWKELQEKHPDMSKTALRNIEPALYTWLYRNDKCWLNSNSPAREKITKQNNRVDWDKRDQELLVKIRNIVAKEIDSKTKPKRLTIGRIGREIGTTAILEKHIDKLPCTKSYLDMVCEDLRTYQIRRIRWVTHIMSKKEVQPKKWQVIKMAGIRKEFINSISDTPNSDLLEQLPGYESNDFFFYN